MIETHERKGDFKELGFCSHRVALPAKAISRRDEAHQEALERVAKITLVPLPALDDRRFVATGTIRASTILGALFPVAGERSY
jgi:hypothetical protein